MTLDFNDIAPLPDHNRRTLSDAEREAPPPIGSIVTFRYQELSDGGVPRFPTYVGVRHDVVWKPGKAASNAAPRPARRGK